MFENNFRPMKNRHQKTVLVTGSSGFIGKNLLSALNMLDDILVLEFNRENSEDDLRKLITQADFIFHLAGVNRPEDDGEFKTGNTDLTQRILDLLCEQKRSIPFLLSSSIQANLDNPYGKSKKEAEDAVLRYGKATSAPTYIFRLPNVFGKWSRPNYNSVVATFCHNIARNQAIHISNPSYEMTLAYITDVVDSFVSCMNGDANPVQDGYCSITKLSSITLGDLASTLYEFRDSRTTLTMPDLSSDFLKALYATYVSYIPEDSFKYSLKENTDDRGVLAEFIKSPSFGQIFVSKTKPGITRGNHWHNTKIEKFFVLCGEAEICFRTPHTNNVIRYNVTGSKLEVVDIPAGYIHNIKNTGKSELVTLFWASEALDPDKPDTYFEQV